MPINPTVGERGLVTAFIGVGILSISVALASMLRLKADGGVPGAVDGYSAWYLMSGLLGGLSAFYLTLKWFGHPDRAGWFKAAAGIIVFSLLASIIGGTLVLPIFGTMFGPLAFVTVMISTPSLAILWGGTLLLSHALVVRWRIERDSLFVPMTKARK